MPVDLNRIAVSAHFTAQKLQNPTIEDKIDVFEDQVYGWILNHAKFLVSPQNPDNQHCGLAVLMLVGSYFESIASFLRGEPSEGKSKTFFGIGFESVFSDVRKAAEEEDPQNVEKVFSDFTETFYSELRCGLFHEAMVRGKIVIRQSEDAVAIVVNTANHTIATIFIDPVHLLGQVEMHFRSYIKKLRDRNQIELRNNFRKAWDGRLTRPGAVLPEQWFAETSVPEGGL